MKLELNECCICAISNSFKHWLHQVCGKKKFQKLTHHGGCQHLVKLLHFFVFCYQIDFGGTNFLLASKWSFVFVHFLFEVNDVRRRVSQCEWTEDA